jgi:hypothetical protein
LTASSAELPDLLDLIAVPETIVRCWWASLVRCTGYEQPLWAYSVEKLALKLKGAASAEFLPIWPHFQKLCLPRTHSSEDDFPSFCGDFQAAEFFNRIGWLLPTSAIRDAVAGRRHHAAPPQVGFEPILLKSSSGHPQQS